MMCGFGAVAVAITTVAIAATATPLSHNIVRPKQSCEGMGEGNPPPVFDIPHSAVYESGTKSLCCQVQVEIIDNDEMGRAPSTAGTSVSRTSTGAGAAPLPPSVLPRRILRWLQSLQVRFHPTLSLTTFIVILLLPSWFAPSLSPPTNSPWRVFAPAH
jgi:hypothetical protein